MKKARQSRKLVFEQLERKAAPSSVLLVTAASDANESIEFPTSGISTDSAVAAIECRAELQYETNQILRFIGENSNYESSLNRQAELPTEEQCMAADEMMEIVAAERNSFLVLSFYDPGSEL